jgi:hypothetical protein
MTETDDARIRVRFGTASDAGPDDALLIEGDAPADHPAVARFNLPAGSTQHFGHNLGCTCCTPRGPGAQALGQLFLARARAEVPWFRSVVAVTRSAAGAGAVQAALTADVVTAARFRADP